MQSSILSVVARTLTHALRQSVSRTIRTATQRERALRIGLVHRVVDDVDAAVAESINQLRTSGPEAVRECKKLIAYVASHDLIDAIPYTIEAIATRRVSEEGQGGMGAFLKKEKTPWAK